MVAQLAVREVDDASAGGRLQPQRQHRHHLRFGGGGHRRLDDHSGRGGNEVLGERPGIGDGGTHTGQLLGAGRAAVDLVPGVTEAGGEVGVVAGPAQLQRPPARKAAVAAGSAPARQSADAVRRMAKVDEQARGGVHGYVPVPGADGDL
ncbi:hypothetical protein OIE78_35505 (plasmid) [Streptomyces cellulosae]|nr:hypothetical protein OG837_34715 [Streptomyces cellulosae]